MTRTLYRYVELLAIDAARGVGLKYVSRRVALVSLAVLVLLMAPRALAQSWISRNAGGGSANLRRSIPQLHRLL